VFFSAAAVDNVCIIENIIWLDYVIDCKYYI
jgi:hypothetical protein